MIVDCHTHVWKYPDHLSETLAEEGGLMRADPIEMTVDLDDHFRAMARVDRAIVLATDFGYSGLKVPNEYVAEYVHAHPEKLIGFASVDPNEKGATEKLEGAIQNLGLRGLKLGPVYQNFDPAGEDAMRVYERANALGIPILFHQATTFPRVAPLKYAHPILLEEVALRFPDLKMVLAHLGHPWEVDTIVLIRKQPNVYADISALFYRPWQFYNSMVLAQEYRVTHKLLFGTDYPVTTPEESIDGLRGINDLVEGTKLPKISGTVIEEIIERNTLEILELA